MLQKNRMIYPLVLLIGGLSGCMDDDDAQKCQTFFDDQTQRPLAAAYCEKSALLGNAKAQRIYSQILFGENKAEEAIVFLERAANQKDPIALFELGQRYEQGNSVAKDVDKAQFYYSQSCQAGEIKGCEREAYFQKLNTPKVDQKKLAEQAKLEQQKLEVERKRLEAEKNALEAERMQREKQLAAEQKLLAERKAFEAEKAKAEKILAAERQRLAEKATQTRSEPTNVNRRSTYGLKFYDGLAAFSENGYYGFVDTQGNVVIPAKFAYAGRFSRKRSAVQDPVTKLWGFINTAGDYVVSPAYCMLGAFSESDGLAGVYQNGYKVGNTCVGGKWGFMNTAGQWVISPVLDHAERFIKGKAKVTYNGETGFINAKGLWVE